MPKLLYHNENRNFANPCEISYRPDCEKFCDFLLFPTIQGLYSEILVQFPSFFAEKEFFPQGGCVVAVGRWKRGSKANNVVLTHNLAFLTHPPVL